MLGGTRSGAKPTGLDVIDHPVGGVTGRHNSLRERFQIARAECPAKAIRALRSDRCQHLYVEDRLDRRARSRGRPLRSFDLRLAATASFGFVVVGFLAAADMTKEP
jgi:hypothetical protein